jgi:hypothetical protein
MADSEDERAVILNAIANLRVFGQDLNLKDLEFDDNLTCILGIDGTFSLHLTIESVQGKLYLYSPLLDGLPASKEVRLLLYETLLEGSMLGGQMAGGGVGVALKEELILLHCTLEMRHAQPNALRLFAPLFVETVEKWRKICATILQSASSANGEEEVRKMVKSMAQSRPQDVIDSATSAPPLPLEEEEKIFESNLNSSEPIRSDRPSTIGQSFLRAIGNLFSSDGSRSGLRSFFARLLGAHEASSSTARSAATLKSPPPTTPRTPSKLHSPLSPLGLKSPELPPTSNPMENANRCLDDFGKSFGYKELEFDANRTCILVRDAKSIFSFSTPNE